MIHINSVLFKSNKTQGMPMKKTREELEQFIKDHFEENFPHADPQSATELLKLLPDNQHTIRYILRIMIENKNSDYWLRYAAANYMLEYFADPFQIKTFLNRVLEVLVASRSERVNSFWAPFMEKLLKIDGGHMEKDERPFEEQLLDDIAQLESYNPECLKNWAWEVEDEKLTCSIGKKKLF